MYLEKQQQIIPALAPNRCRKSQLYFSLRQRISFRHPSLHLLPALPRAPQGTQSRRQVWETSVGNKCGKQVWETSVRDKCRRQVWETSVGDNCKLMRPKTSRVGDTCGRRAGDKCEIMRRKTPRVGDKCGRQGGDKCGRQVWETSGRQV